MISGLKYFRRKLVVYPHLKHAFSLSPSFSIEVDCRIIIQFKAVGIDDKGMIILNLLPFSLSKLQLEVNSLWAHSADVVECVRTFMEDHLAHACIEFETRLFIEHCLSVEIDDHELFSGYIPIRSSEDGNFGFFSSFTFT